MENLVSLCLQKGFMEIERGKSKWMFAAEVDAIGGRLPPKKITPRVNPRTKGIPELPFSCHIWVQSGAFPRISPTHHPDKRKAATPCITKDCGLKTWRRRRESNPRMTVLQTIALPLGYSAVIPKREAIE